MKPKILILGAAGFLGFNLLRKLVDEGKEVRVLARPSLSLSRIRGFEDQVEIVIGDFLDDSIFESLLEGIETVYHLITTTFPSTSVHSGVYDVSTNLIPTIRLLEACKKKGVKKVIYASSGGTIYGVPQSTPIKEDHPLTPISSYGQSKLMIENFLSFFTRANQVCVHILRISNPYGEGQKPFGVQGVIAAAMNSAKNGIRLNVIGRGKSVRDYIHVDDVIRALIKVSLLNRSQVLNISSGKGIRVTEVIKAIEKVSQKKIFQKRIVRRLTDVDKNILDNARAKAIMKWVPLISFEEGLKKTWDSFSQNHDF